jgi:sulfite reductase (NADPH) flavoprotein alpha-component
VVEALQGAMGWSGTEDADGSPVSDALKLTYDITSLSPQVLEKYNAFAQSDTLTDLLQAEKRSELMDYIYGREVIDIVTEFPVSGLAPADLVGCLRKLAPRLFSVASSLKAYEEEVHLTVGAVRYCSHSRERLGVCSTFLADRVDIGDRLPTYVHANKNFRLPADPSAKMIMVGPGTGIAPFRAFLQDREADGAAGDNWLFFGDQHATTDFLYQLEWQRFLKSGLLSQMDVAFSRDQDHKIYVQHRMQEHAAQLYAWLQEGAYFYVCGDEGNMAHDVHNTLVDIVAKHGGMAVDAAEEHVKNLQRDKRYQRDVY